MPRILKKTPESLFSDFQGSLPSTNDNHPARTALPVSFHDIKQSIVMIDSMLVRPVTSLLDIIFHIFLHPFRNKRPETLPHQIQVHPAEIVIQMCYFLSVNLENTFPIFIGSSLYDATQIPQRGLLFQTTALFQILHNELQVGFLQIRFRQRIQQCGKINAQQILLGLFACQFPVVITVVKELTG